MVFVVLGPNLTHELYARRSQPVFPILIYPIVLPIVSSSSYTSPLTPVLTFLRFYDCFQSLHFLLGVLVSFFGFPFVFLFFNLDNATPRLLPSPVLLNALSASQRFSTARQRCRR